MSNSNSFGGKLKKVLASMCSLFVGASGVSQANPPDTKMPDKLTIDKDMTSFGFGDFGWKLASNVGTANKENSWLVREKEGARWQQIGQVHGVNVDVGFFPTNFCCNFDIWVNGKLVVCVSVPKGMLFDVMRYFELNYYPSGNEARDNGAALSCKKGKLNDKTEDEVFLRFILWAFCGANKMIDSGYGSEVKELKEAIFKFAVEENDPGDDEDNYAEKTVEVPKENDVKEEKKCYALRPGYFVGIFSDHVREVYGEFLGCSAADLDDISDLIAKLNGKKEDLKNQKHTSKYLLSVLGAFVGGGALVEGAHRFLGAKRSRSSEVNKGKPSSNKKGEQRAKRNLKKQKS